MSAACRLTHRALQKNWNTDVNTNVFRQNTEFYWTKEVSICQTFVFAFTSDVKIDATQSPVPRGALPNYISFFLPAPKDNKKEDC